MGVLNYWSSIGVLFVWLAILTVVGWRIADWAGPRLRPLARAYLSPALGLAFFMILATAAGWLVGARTAIAVPATLIVAMLSLYRAHDLPKLARIVVSVAAVGFIVSLPVFVTVILFSGTNVYNDTFTYLVHGQWLQSHAFRRAAQSTPFSPAYTQVALYQGLGLRMGASFFLAWVQAASPFSWSIQVYPAVAALALTIGTIGVAGLAQAWVPGCRNVGWLWAAAAGTAMSGFSFGAFNGFLPQMAGLAILPAMLALLAWFRPAGMAARSIRRTIPLALVIAAIGYSYSEILPLVAIALAVWFGLNPTTARSARLEWLLAGGVSALLLLLLWNAELLRISRALTNQSHAVVGWPVPWTVLEFVAHAAGLRSASGDGDAPLFVSPLLMFVAGGGAAALFCAPVIYWIRKRERSSLAAPFVFLLLGSAAMLYFRYHAASPWPVGAGQTGTILGFRIG